MRFVIIHGAYGNLEENWLPWLRKGLEEDGHEVIIPRFPTPEGQTLENWLKIFDGRELNENTIIIGHSLGVPFSLTLLEKHKVKAAFFVAGFVEKLNVEKYNKINASFIEKEFDWNAIKQNCSTFYVYVSDNDYNVPLEIGKAVAYKLGVEPIIIRGAGHFNTKAGYDKFPKLLEDIKTLID